MRQLVGYLGLRAGIALVGALPRTVAINIAEVTAATLSPLFGSRREMALRHARRLGVADPRRHVRAVFAAYGRYWAETLWMRPRRRAAIDRTLVLDGEDRLVSALQAGRGMIFALPHLGNWEFAGPLADRYGFELVAVAENLANRRLRDWFVELRRQLGIGIVLATGSATVMRELEAVLARGGAVALLCDRDLRGRGVAVDFFGERTTLPAGPATLAHRTRATLLPVAAYFEPGGGHRVVVSDPIAVDPDGDRAKVVAEATQAVALALEKLIAAAPEQWHLLQPNWPSDRQPRVGS